MEGITSKFCAVILAAGKSTRFKSRKGVSKIFHPLCGIPMIEHILRTLSRLSPVQTLVVLSPDLVDEFRSHYGSMYEVAVQEEALGTGDALNCALPSITDEVDYVLVLPGDAPLVSAKAISEVLTNAHGGDGAILTFTPPSPRGYGRILRDSENYFVSRIIEESETDEKTAGISECNSGIYAFDRRWISSALERAREECGTKNAKGEYFLTDVVNFLRMVAVQYEPYVDLLGINDRADLALVETVLQERKISELARGGVTFVRPETSYVEADVEIGSDTVIFPSCVLRGRTTVGEGCEIGPMCYIENSSIGAGSKVTYSHLVEVHTEEEVKIGPFANLRPGTILSQNSKVGDFVELKNTRVGKGSKIPHLSYIGDAEIGSGVNVGAGTISCNYDGFAKHKTIIEDDAFIGSNNTLVAPIRIGKGSYTAAGSTLTKDVPEESLAVARARQENKEGYAKKLREKMAKKSSQEKGSS